MPTRISDLNPRDAAAIQAKCREEGVHLLIAVKLDRHGECANPVAAICSDGDIGLDTAIQLHALALACADGLLAHFAAFAARAGWVAPGDERDLIEYAHLRAFKLTNRVEASLVSEPTIHPNRYEKP